MNKILKYIKRHGLSSLIIKVVSLILRKDIIFLNGKNEIEKLLIKKYNSSVIDGPYKGMKIDTKNIWWGKFDLSSKILGTYESQISNLIQNKCKEFNTFLDVGAAHGYHAVGVALKSTFNIHAFEIEKKGREAIKVNAKLNGVLNQTKVHGKANSNDLLNLINVYGNAIILIDIEGEEYNLLNKTILTSLKDCLIIVELHPWLAPNGTKLQKQLIETSKGIFNVQIIKRDSYLVPKNNVLKNFCENDVLLAISEGRFKQSEWLILSPR